MNDLKKFNGTLTLPQTDKYLKDVLGNKKDSFVANLTALVSSNTNLQACEPLTLLYAGLKATALDLPLDPNLGFAYVIPYKNSKKNITEAQFQIGFKGFKQLAIRTGQFKTINASDVREGEIVSFNRLHGTINFNWIENETERKGKKIIGYVSYFELNNGFTSIYYMTCDEILSHANRYSSAYKMDKKYNSNQSQWSDEDGFQKMALKTVTKLNLSRNAPLSVEQQLSIAIKSDQSVITDKGEEYVDNDGIQIPKEQAENPLLDNNNIIQDVEIISEVEHTEEDVKENNNSLFDNETKNANGKSKKI